MTLSEKLEKLQASPKEQRAFAGWQADPVAKPVAPETAGRMLALFLKGYSCQQIRDQEPFRAFSLGAIVHARLANDWDGARAEVAANIRQSMIDQAVEVGEETSRTVLDLLSCVNKKLGKEARDYLMGLTHELPIEVKSVTQLKTLAELFAMTLDPKAWPQQKQRVEDVGVPSRVKEESDPLAGLTPEQKLANLAASRKDSHAPTRGAN